MDSTNLDASATELIRWARATAVALTPQSRRYLRALLQGQDRLPLWVSDIALRALCEMDDTTISAPLETAALALMQSQVEPNNATAAINQVDPNVALIRSLYQDTHVVAAAEALQDFLKRIETLVDSVGASIPDIQKSIHHCLAQVTYSGSKRQGHSLPKPF